MFRKQDSAYRRPAWRSLLLVLVFCGVIWAFWQNSQSQLDLLNTRISVWDDPPVLTDNEKTALRDMIGQFKSRFGIEVRMELLEVPLHQPVSQTPLIYLGINPKTGDSLVGYPGWLRLPPDFAEMVKAEFITPRLAKREYAYALADSLRAFWDELTRLEQVGLEQPGAETAPPAPAEPQTN